MYLCRLFNVLAIVVSISISSQANATDPVVKDTEGLHPSKLTPLEAKYYTEAIVNLSQLVPEKTSVQELIPRLHMAALHAASCYQRWSMAFAPEVMIKIYSKSTDDPISIEDLFMKNFQLTCRVGEEQIVIPFCEDLTEFTEKVMAIDGFHTTQILHLLLDLHSRCFLMTFDLKEAVARNALNQFLKMDTQNMLKTCLNSEVIGREEGVLQLMVACLSDIDPGSFCLTYLTDLKQVPAAIAHPQLESLCMQAPSNLLELRLRNFIIYFILNKLSDNEKWQRKLRELVLRNEASNRDNQALRYKIEKLQHLNKLLMVKDKETALVLTAAKKKADEDDQLIIRLQDHTNDMSSKNAAIKEQSAKLASENFKLREAAQQQIAASQKQKEAEARIRKVEAEKATQSQARIEELEQALALLKQQNAAQALQLEDKTRQMEQMQSEKEEDEKSVQRRIDAATHTQARLLDELDQRCDELQQASKALQLAQFKITEFEAKNAQAMMSLEESPVVQELRRQNQALQTRIAAQNNRALNYDTNMERIYWENCRLQQQLQMLSAQNSHLTTCLKTCDQQLLQQRSEAEVRVIKYEKMIADLQAQITQLTEEQKGKDEKTQQLVARLSAQAESIQKTLDIFKVKK